MVLTLLITGCNKEKRTSKKLEGNWSIVKYQFTNSNGFSEYYYPTVNVIISKFSSGKSSFRLTSNYTNNIGNSTQKNVDAQFEFKNKDAEYYTLNQIVDGALTDSIFDGRILIVTKDEMRTEFTDSQGRHTYLLSK